MPLRLSLTLCGSSLASHPADNFRGTPPSAIVHAIPEFIWGMSVKGRNTMNRRSVLSISAMTAFGLALLPGNAFAQSAADMEGVKAASKAFYAALAVIDNGEAMEKVYAHTPYITNVSPRSKSIAVGWDAVKKYREEDIKSVASRNLSLSESHIHVNGNLAWEIGHETGEVKFKDGTVRKSDNFVTNVFEKIDGRWLMVSHHAQPKPQ
jgi:ketosteroid isomerase-like protein